MEIKHKNILVTGGTGFVGSHLVEELLKQGCNVVTTYQTTNPLSYFSLQNLDKKAIMVQADITNFEKMFDIITKFNIDYIFHLAAQAIVDVAYHNPRRTLESNINGTINILESVRLFSNVKGVIVASSDKAYGKLNKEKYLETDALKGDHPYEVSKSATDLICTSYYETYNVPVVITRFGNIYGEGDLNFSRIIPGIMQSIIEKEILQIRSDGKFVRDYLHVKDVVGGYIRMAELSNEVKGEAFNFGSDDTLSVLNLIEIIEGVLQKKINIIILDNAKNEIPYQSLDYSKIKKTLNWSNKYTIKNSIEDIFNYYKKIL